MKNRPQTWILAAALLAGALARLPGLGQEPFWTDEMHSLRVAGVRYAADAPDWRPGDLLAVVQGPLFMLLLHGWAALVGVGEAALRLLPLLCGLLALPLMLRAAGRLAGAATGRAALWLLALSPFHVWYSRELRGYALVMLAALLAAWLLERLLDALRAGRRLPAAAGLAYAGSLLLGLGASFTMGFVVIAQALGALPGLARSGRRARAAALAAVLVLLVAGWPWITTLGARLDWGRLLGSPRVVEAPLRGGTAFPAGAVPYTFYTFAAGYSLGPSLAALHAAPPAAVLGRHAATVAAVGLVFGGLALAGVIALWRRRRRALLVLTLWILVPFGLLAVLAAADVKPWNPRYVGVAQPAFLILVAAGVTAVGGRRWPFLLAVPLAIGALGIGNLLLEPRYWKEDYRAAGAYLDAHLLPTEVLIAEGAPGPLFYYMHARPAVYQLLHPQRIGDAAELARRLDAVTRDARRVWLVRARVWFADPENQVGGLLGAARPRREHASFRGVTIDAYGAPDGATSGASPASGAAGRQRDAAGRQRRDVAGEQREAAGRQRHDP